MKSYQQQAREMYFQSDLSKTEIAAKLSVGRSTVYRWSVEGDWEKLRASARNMPAMLAEKCYYLIGHFTDHLLSREGGSQPITKADVEILFKLTKTVNMLKQGSTINENMETFTRFFEGLQQKDAGLADALLPYADDFISSRAAVSPSSFMLSGYTKEGFKQLPEKDIMEKWQDEQDAASIMQEMRADNVYAQDLASRNSAEKHAASPGNPAHEAVKTSESTGTQTAADPATPHHAALSNDKEKNLKARFWENLAKEKTRKENQKQRKAA